MSFEMKIESLFRKLNLIDSIILNIDSEPQEFINKLKQIVDDEPPYLFDELHSSKKLYVGNVEEQNFFLRKKRKFMNFDIQQSSAKGKINLKDNKTEVELKILGYDIMFLISIIAGPIFFLILFSTIIVNEAYPALILFVPIAIIFLKVPYYFGRKNMKRFKIELEENLLLLCSQN